MKYLALMAIALLLTGCNETLDDMNDFHKVYGSEITDAAELFTSISENIVVFGHQSVGENILDGIAAWEEESGASLNRRSSRDMSTLEEPVFIDFRVGQNGDPKSKVDDFVSVVESIPTNRNPIVFFKFCYVDVEAETDTDEVFDYYKEKMLYLKESYPHARLVLMTIPLTTVQTGWKATAKKILSKELYGYQENVLRQKINQRIIDELSGEFPVFDLALVESTLPDGTKSTYDNDGTAYPCLTEMYTSDGGHLNSYGAKIVSYNLLAYLMLEMNGQ